MTFNRSSSGISFNGRSPFQSLCLLQSLAFTRGSNSTCEIIVESPIGAFGVGVYSDNVGNTNANNQPSNSEISVIFSLSSNVPAIIELRGRGNRIRGTNVLDSYPYYKLSFTEDIQPGSALIVYGLNAIATESDLNDESNCVYKCNLSNNLRMQGTTLVPHFIPVNNSSHHLVAARIIQ